MRRVLGDWFRQTRGIWLVILAAFTVGGVLVLRRGAASGAGRLLTFAALVGDLVGVMTVMSSTDALRVMRPVFTLPIRRRDFGAGLWFLSVIGPVTLTVAAKLLVVGLSPIVAPGSAVNLPWVASSGVFDLAFAGSLCWLILQAGRREHAGGAHRWLARVYVTLGILAFVGGTLALVWYMPTPASPWTWPSVGLLVGMLALTVAGYRQSERLAINGGTVQLLVGGLSADRGPRNAPVVRMAFDGRLSSPRRMLWDQFRSAVLLQALILSLLTVMVAIPFSKTPGVFEQLRQAWSDPGELDPQMWVLGWILYTGIGMRRWQGSRILVLRGLPMSWREINHLLLLRPAITWLAFWLVALPFFSQASSTSYAWLGLGSLAGMIGATAVASAALLHWHQSPFQMFAVMAVNYTLLFGHPWRLINAHVFTTGAGQFAALALGIAGVGLAYLWNGRLLTSSSALYRRTQ